MSDNTEIPIYVVIAYRWGWTNNGKYIVAVSLSRDVVDAAAEEVCESSGGKYGVTVIEYIGDNERPVAYFPSSYGESFPHYNHRIDAAESIGLAVLGRDEERGDVPEWLKQEVARAEVVAKCTESSLNQWLEKDYSHLITQEQT